MPGGELYDLDERIGGGVQAPVVLVKVVAVEEVVFAVVVEVVGDVLSLSTDPCIELEKGKTDASVLLLLDSPALLTL